MVNYGNGKIYKIVSSYTDMIYIGSTTKKYLSQRMAVHKSDLKKWMDDQDGYVASFPILLYEDVRIILIENYPCATKDELTAREQHFIDLYCDIVINCHKAYTGLTIGEYQKQYRKDNQEQIKHCNKQYYQHNKQKIRQKQKQYYFNNKEKINHAHKFYMKAYIKENKEILQQKQNQKYECECGGKYTHVHKAQHERTYKHQNYLDNLE